MPDKITTYTHAAGPAVVCFGPFRLDRPRFLLTRNEHPVDLPRIAMEVLFLLVDRPHILVTRADLVHAIWPGIDPDDKIQSVNTAINRIRTALRDDPAKPRYVQTVIGKGYRFIATIEPEAAPPRPGHEHLGSATLTTAPSSPPPPDPQPPLPPSPATEMAVPRFAVAPLILPPAPTPAHSGQPAVASPKSGPRWLRSALIFCILLLAVSTLAILHLWSEGHPSQTAHFALDTPTALTSNDAQDVIDAAAISPDGTEVAFVDVEGVKLINRNALVSRLLGRVALEAVARIAWFPDGTRFLVGGVAASGTPELWVVSTATPQQPPRLFRSDAQFAAPSPDGTHVLYLSGSGHELWVSNPDGATPRLLFSGSTGEDLAEPLWLDHNGPILLQSRSRPNERTLLHNPNPPPDQSRSNLLTLRATDGTVLLTQNAVLMTNPCLYPDGTVLFVDRFSEGHPLSAVRLDLATGQLLSTPHPLSLPAGTSIAGISVARTGETALLLKTGTYGVSVATLDPSARQLLSPQHLTYSAHGAFPHAWTPDSKAVLFELYSDQHWWLFSQIPGRRGAEPLTGHPLEGTGARVTPDRKWLLFNRAAAKGDPPILFRLPYPLALGSTAAPVAPQPLPVPAGDLRCPTLAGACVLRIRNDANHRIDLLSLDADTARTTLLQSLPWTESNFGDWGLSPDGKEVVLCSGTDQPGELRVLSLASGREIALHFPVSVPFLAVNWQANGRGWFASTANGEVTILYSLSATGTATPLYSTHTPTTWAVPSPDGRSIAYVNTNRERNVWLTHPIHP